MKRKTIVDETIDVIDETLTAEQREAKKSLIKFMTVFIVCFIFILVSFFFKYPNDLAIRISVAAIATSKYISILKKDKKKQYILYYTVLLLVIYSIIIYKLFF